MRSSFPGAVPHLHGGARPLGLLRRVVLIHWFALTRVSREKNGMHLISLTMPLLGLFHEKSAAYLFLAPGLSSDLISMGLVLILTSPAKKTTVVSF
jgi:hypothetical protein